MSIYFVVCVVVTLFVSIVLLEPSQVMLPNLVYIVCYVGPLEHLRGLTAIAYSSDSASARSLARRPPRQDEIAVQFDMLTFMDPDWMVQRFGGTEPLRADASDLDDADYARSLAHGWHVFPRSHFRVGAVVDLGWPWPRP